MSEETGKQVPDNSADCVGCEDVEAVIELEDEFELGGKIAEGTTNDAVRDSSS